MYKALNYWVFGGFAGAKSPFEFIDCAEYALLSDGQHRIPFDEAVKVMLETGRDMSLAYRETARGGLATVQTAVKS